MKIDLYTFVFSLALMFAQWALSGMISGALFAGAAAMAATPLTASASLYALASVKPVGVVFGTVWSSTERQTGLFSKLCGGSGHERLHSWTSASGALAE